MHRDISAILLDITASRRDNAVICPDIDAIHWGIDAERQDNAAERRDNAAERWANAAEPLRRSSLSFNMLLVFSPLFPVRS